jgi:hypothetical protein
MENRIIVGDRITGLQDYKRSRDTPAPEMPVRACHALFVLGNPRAPLGLAEFSSPTQSVALGYSLIRLWRSSAEPG